jgi:hypothetical protein
MEKLVYVLWKQPERSIGSFARKGSHVCSCGKNTLRTNLIHTVIPDFAICTIVGPRNWIL